MSASSVWDDFSSVVSGFSAGLAEAMERYGGKVGGNIGATKDLAVSLTMAINEYNMNPSTDNAAKVEEQAVKMLTGIGLTEAGGILGTPGGPIGAVVGGA